MRRVRLKVKEAMMAQNVSVGEMAKRTGLLRRTIVRMMDKPDEDVPIAKLALVGVALGVPTSQLFEDVEK